MLLEFIAFFVALFCHFGILFMVLFLTPVFIYRFILILYVKCFKSGYEITKGYDSYISNNLDPPLNCGVTFLIELGNARTDKAKEIIYDVTSKVLDHPDLQKFKQTIVKYGGFHFWKDVENFRVEDVVVVHEEPITEAEMEELREGHFLDKSYGQKSLLQFHVYPNFIPEHPCDQKLAVACAKIHHALGDWFSLVKVTNIIRQVVDRDFKVHFRNNDMDSKATSVSSSNGYSTHKDSSSISDNLQKQSDTDKSHKTTNNIFIEWIIFFILLLKFFVMGPFELIFNAIPAYYYGFKRFLPAATFEYHAQDLRLSLSDIKSISKKHDVRTTTLVIAAFAAAVRQLLMDKGVRPRKFPFFCPIPLTMMRREDKIQNFFGILPLMIPLEEEQPLRRLTQIRKYLSSMQRSTYPFSFYVFYRIWGSLPVLIQEQFKLMELPIATLVMSIVVGEIGKEVGGFPLRRLYLQGCFPYGKTNLLGLYSICTNGELQIRCKGDKVLFPDQEACNKFLRVFSEELEILKSSVSKEENGFSKIQNKKVE